MFFVHLALSYNQIRVDGKDLQAGKAVVHTVRGVLVPDSAPIGEAVAPTDECVHTVKTGDTLDVVAKVRRPRCAVVCAALCCALDCAALPAVRCLPCAVRCVLCMP